MLDFLKMLLTPEFFFSILRISAPILFATLGAIVAIIPPIIRKNPRMVVNTASAGGNFQARSRAVTGQRMVLTISARITGRTAAQINAAPCHATQAAAAITRKRRHQPASHRPASPMTSPRSRVSSPADVPVILSAKSLPVRPPR